MSQVDPTTSIPTQSPPGFRAAQWRVLLALMICYLSYYTGRLNFGWASDGMAQDPDLKLSRDEIAWLGAAMLTAYGVGQFVNGNLGDKFGARRLMTVGALLSLGCNWITGFGTSFVTLLVPWTLNGYVQSLGWAPGGRLVSNWWARHERGRAFGFYVLAAGFSSVLSYGLSILVLQEFSEDRAAWRWVFRLPVLALIPGAVVFYLFARDRPEDLGYPAIDDEPVEESEAGETSWARYAAVLSNRAFWFACVSIGCESAARWGLMIWVPKHYLDLDWRSDPSTLWVTLSLPVGMAFGSLVAGQLSDRLFGSNRSRPVALFLGIACVVTWAMSLVPLEARLIHLVLLFVAGFCVFGPHSLYFAMCPDLLGRRRSGTGVGIMDAAAYGVAAIGQVAIAQGSVFVVCSVCCAVGAGCVLFVRK